MIYNRDRLVAAVVGGSALLELLDRREREAGESVASAFAGLRALAGEAGEPGWELEVPERRDRPSPFE